MPKTSISSNIFHENLSVVELLISLFFLFSVSNISSKLCLEELITISLDLKLFFIKLTELGKIEKIEIIIKLKNNVLKKL